MKRAIRFVCFALLALYASGHILELLPAGAKWHALSAFLSAASLPALAAGLLVIVLMADHDRERLEHALKKAEDTLLALQRELKGYDDTREDLRALADELDATRSEVLDLHMYFHGRVLYSEKRYSEAAAVFEEIVTRDSANARANFWTGESLLRAKQVKRAIIFLEKAAISSNEPSYYESLGEAYAKHGRPEQAELTFQKALDLGARNREHITVLLARAQARNDVRKAMQTLRHVVEANPLNANATILLVRFYIDDGELGQALDICDRALKYNSRNWGIYASRAEVLLIRGAPGDYEGANRDLEVARKHSPRDFNLYRVEGQALIRAAIESQSPEGRRLNLSKAIDCFEDGLSKISGPYSASLLTGLSECYIGNGDLERARECSRESVGLNPNHHVNHVLLCAALLESRDYGILVEAAESAMLVNGVIGRVFGGCYKALGLLLGGKELAPDERRVFAENLLRADPWLIVHRREWEFLSKGRWRRDIPGLSASNKELVEAVAEFLYGKIPNESLRAQLAKTDDEAPSNLGVRKKGVA